MRSESRVFFTIWMSFVLLGTFFVSVDLNFLGDFNPVTTGNAATIIVDDDPGQDYTTIQSAVNNADDGDTIEIYPGDYYESVSISGNNLNIIGSGIDLTTVDSSGVITFYISGDNNVISNLHATGGFSGFFFDFAINNTISGCKVTGHADAGVYFDDSQNNTVINCNLSDNLVGATFQHSSKNNTLIYSEINENDYNAITMKGFGNNSILANNIMENNDLGGAQNYPTIWIESHNNTISKNYIYDQLATGIFVSEARNNLIAFNDVGLNLRGFTVTDGSTLNKIVNNTIFSNYFNGVELKESSSNNTLAGNSFYDNNFLGGNDYPAVWADTANNSMIDNQIDAGGYTGIFIRDTSNNYLDNNTVSNSIHGIYFFNTFDMHLSNNTCVHASLDGVFVEDSENITLENNFCHFNNRYGIELINTPNNKISRNNLSYNYMDTYWGEVRGTGFEDDNDEGWVHGGAQDTWERGTPSFGPNGANSGSNAWGTDLNSYYEPNSDCSLYMPGFYAEDHSVLQFYHWYSMENGWDTGKVEFSQDGGITWGLLVAYTGSSNGWQEVNIPLDDYPGDVIIRFRFTTDGNVELDGWFIDDLKILNSGLQDFDSSGDDGWTHSGTGDMWEHGVPSQVPGAHSGDRTWATNLNDKYDNDTECSLYSPEISITGDESLVFWHWYEIEEGWDRAYLEITDNGGGDWDTLNWYDDNSDGWLREEVALDGYTGNVQIRFRFTSDGSVTFRGWYIDDVFLLGGGGMKIFNSSINEIISNRIMHSSGNGIFMNATHTNLLYDNYANYNRDDGVHLMNSFRTTVNTSTCENNLNNGIEVINSMNTTLGNNTLVGNINGLVLAAGSHRAVVTGNLIEDNLDMGHYQQRSSSAVISGNTVTDNINMGIYIDTSHQNHISSNTVTFNDNGLELYISDENTIDRNVFSENWGNGIQMQFSSFNNITNNEINTNWDNGVFVNYSNSNNLIDNIIQDNWWDGILMDYSEYNSFIGNSVDLNWDDGFQANNSNFINILNSTFLSNWYNGLVIDNSYGYNIINNNISLNNDGIHSYYADYLYIINNTFMDNWDDGISLNYSWYDVISGNLISGNGYGLFLNYRSAYNWIDNNTVTGNVYGMLVLKECWTSIIENNTITANGMGIYLADDIDFFTIRFNHLLYNQYYGVVIADNESEGNLIHHNNFIGNNGSSYQAYDDGIGTIWDNGAEGNFWSNYTALYPQATHNGVVWDIPYKPTGISLSADRYPLVYCAPGLDEQLPGVLSDNTPIQATTGDPFRFSVELGDDLGIVYANILYSFDGVTFLNESMLISQNGEWYYDIMVPSDALDLYYMFYMIDFGRNQVTTSEVSIPVVDNDDPVFIVDNTPSTAYTGDVITFSLTAGDNILVTSVSVFYSYDSTNYYELVLTPGDAGLWSGDHQINDQAAQMDYYFRITDGLNEINTNVSVITITDNDLPSIEGDETDEIAYTGDYFGFKLNIEDNIGVDSVWVNYTFNSLDILTLELNSSRADTFRGSLLIPDSAQWLEYYPVVLDLTGNMLIGNLTNISVADNDIPLADAGDDLELDQGTSYILNAGNSTDNVGIVNYSWYIVLEGDDWELTGEQAEFVFELNGDYFITLVVSDEAGNLASDSINVTVLDRIEPTAAAGDDLIIDQYETVELNGNGSIDNVGIKTFTWDFIYQGREVTLEGMKTTFVFNMPGDYLITLTVTDEMGYSDNDTLLLIVRDIESPIANAGSDIIIEKGTTLSLDGSNSTDNMGIKTYRWYFEYDGSEEILNGEINSFIFDIAGNYNITLNVSDGAFNFGEDTIRVKVIDPSSSDDDTTGDDDNVPDGNEQDDDSKSWLDSSWAIILIIIIIIILISLFLFLVIFRRRKKEDKEEEIETDLGYIGEDGTGDDDEVEVDITGDLIEPEREQLEEKFTELENLYYSCQEMGMDLSEHERDYQSINDRIGGEASDPKLYKDMLALMNVLDVKKNEMEEGAKEGSKKIHNEIDGLFIEASKAGVDISYHQTDYESAISYFKQGDYVRSKALFSNVLNHLKRDMGKNNDGDMDTSLENRQSDLHVGTEEGIDVGESYEGQFALPQGDEMKSKETEEDIDDDIGDIDGIYDEDISDEDLNMEDLDELFGDLDDLEDLEELEELDEVDDSDKSEELGDLDEIEIVNENEE